LILTETNRHRKHIPKSIRKQLILLAIEKGNIKQTNTIDYLNATTLAIALQGFSLFLCIFDCLLMVKMPLLQPSHHGALALCTACA